MDKIIESVSNLILELEIVKSELVMINEGQKEKKNKCKDITNNLLYYVKWKK